MSTDIKAKHFKLIGADTTHIAAAQTLGGAGNFTLANTKITFENYTKIRRGENDKILDGLNGWTR